MAIFGFGTAEGLAYKYKADKDIAYVSAQKKAKADAQVKTSKEATEALSKLKTAPVTTKYNTRRIDALLESTAKDIGSTLLDPTLDPIVKSTRNSIVSNKLNNSEIYAEDKRVADSYIRLNKDAEDGHITPDVFQAEKAKYNHYDEYGGQEYNYESAPKDTLIKDWTQVVGDLEINEYKDIPGWQLGHKVVTSTGKVSGASIDSAAKAFLEDETHAWQIKKKFDKFKEDNPDSKINTPKDWLINQAQGFLKNKRDMHFLTDPKSGDAGWEGDKNSAVLWDLYKGHNVETNKDLDLFLPKDNKTGKLAAGTKIRVGLGFTANGAPLSATYTTKENDISVNGSVGGAWQDKVAGDMLVTGRFKVDKFEKMFPNGIEGDFPDPNNPNDPTTIKHRIIKGDDIGKLNRASNKNAMNKMRYNDELEVTEFTGTVGDVKIPDNDGVLPYEQKHGGGAKSLAKDIGASNYFEKAGITGRNTGIKEINWKPAVGATSTKKEVSPSIFSNKTSSSSPNGGGTTQAVKYERSKKYPVGKNKAMLTYEGKDKNGKDVWSN